MNRFKTALLGSSLLLGVGCTSFERDNQFDPASGELLTIQWESLPSFVSADSIEWRWRQEGQPSSFEIWLDSNLVMKKNPSKPMIALGKLDEGPHLLVLNAKSESGSVIDDTLLFNVDAIQSPTLLVSPQKINLDQSVSVQLEAAFGAIACEFKLLGLTEKEIKNLTPAPNWNVQSNWKKDTLHIIALGSEDLNNEHLEILHFNIDTKQDKGKISFISAEAGNNNYKWDTTLSRGGSW